MQGKSTGKRVMIYFIPSFPINEKQTIKRKWEETKN
jgi:hypothetical protein